MNRRNTAKPALTRILSEGLTRTGVNNAEVGRRLGVRRQTVQGWLKRNVFPDEPAFLRLTEMADLTGPSGNPMTVKEAQAKFAFQLRKERMSRIERAAPATLPEAFRQLDIAQRSVCKTIERAASGLLPAMNSLGDRNFILTFTASVFPYLYRTEGDESETYLAKEGAAAVARGAYLIAFVPSRKIRSHYRKHFNLNRLESDREFEHMCDRYKEWVLAHWRRAKVKPGGGKIPAAAWFDEHVFQVVVGCDNTPYFLPGWTFSVFGEYRPPKDTFLRGMFRTQDDAFGAWVGHPACPLFESRLQYVADCLLSDECRRLASKGEERRAHALNILRAMLTAHHIKYERLKRAGD
ncbi:MAG TPA: hypothetical protein VD866_17390 [Urbifossiella sp.]|nr:hypothetical protein [Urbifossiella sp.]